MTVSPNPVDAGGETYIIEATGFPPNELIHISAATPGCCSAHNVWTNEDGEFSMERVSGTPGSYEFTAIQVSYRGKRNKAHYRVLYSLSFDVL
jgi:hypothetical protein